MPMVQVDLRRDVFQEKGKAISQAIHAGLVEQHPEQVGVRHDDIPVCVVDVGFDDWHAGTPVNE